MELKPCPFCGGEPNVHLCDGAGVYHTNTRGVNVLFGRQLTHKMIVCNKCGVRTKAYLTDKGLFKAWNRRLTMAKEYIEREALKKEFNLYFGGVSHAVIANRILDAIPAADVVEVVRCFQCKHFGRDLGYGKHDCKKYEMPYCLENDFCSYGERKDDGTQV